MSLTLQVSRRRIAVSITSKIFPATDDQPGPHQSPNTQRVIRASL